MVNNAVEVQLQLPVLHSSTIHDKTVFMEDNLKFLYFKVSLGTNKDDSRNFSPSTTATFPLTTVAT